MKSINVLFLVLSLLAAGTGWADSKSGPEKVERQHGLENSPQDVGSAENPFRQYSAPCRESKASFRAVDNGTGLGDGSCLGSSQEPVSSPKSLYPVTIEYDDSLKNGALIGMAIGGAVGVLFGIGTDQAQDATLTLAVSGVVSGFVLGIGFDSLKRSRRTVYLAGPSSSGLRLGLVPIVSRNRKGLLASLEF